MRDDSSAPTVTKQFHFHAAHVVPAVKDCKEVHGHTYHLEIEIYGIRKKEGPEKGMVANARRIKSEVKDAVVGKLDHSFIAEGDERIVPALERLDYRVVKIGSRTTAENLVVWIKDRLDEETNLNIFRARLWETDSMYAEVWD